MTASAAIQRADRAGREAWGAAWQPASVCRAPGRLELLGNHIDYNGGPVLCGAIDRDAVCLVSPAPYGIEITMADTAERTFIDPAALSDWLLEGGKPSSMDYVRGVVASAIASGSGVREGVRIAVAGDVPIGFGLSSSAALLVALSLALHVPVPSGRDLVLRAQAAEHRAGTPCGAMDHSASVGGHVILYNGADVSWRVIEPNLDGFVFAVADSGVARSLATSSYPKRVAESREALSIVNAALGTSLSDLALLSAGEWDLVASLPGNVLPDALKARVRHIVTETARVRDGIEAMKTADWVRFGSLMNASGASSAGDYSISHPRVEDLVELAKSVDGVVGARMMGGGEGGAALVLLRATATEALRGALEGGYYSRHSGVTNDPVRVFQFSAGASSGAFHAG